MRGGSFDSSGDWVRQLWYEAEERFGELGDKTTDLSSANKTTVILTLVEVWGFGRFECVNEIPAGVLFLNLHPSCLPRHENSGRAKVVDHDTYSMT